MRNNEIQVCLVDYGSGNVRSVFNMIESMDVPVSISKSPADFQKATHLILPGVGAFGSAMEKLNSMRIIEDLTQCVLNQKKPFLGICVGMQILADSGLEHGQHQGLGWIPGEVKKMDVGKLTLPHVGWNNIIIKNRSDLIGDLNDDVDFYFTHSYSFCAEDPTHVSAVFEYGGQFAAIIHRDNIFGVQFHPEKSQKAGKILLNNFFAYHEEKKTDPSFAA